MFILPNFLTLLHTLMISLYFYNIHRLSDTKVNGKLIKKLPSDIDSMLNEKLNYMKKEYKANGKCKTEISVQVYELIPTTKTFNFIGD